MMVRLKVLDITQPSCCLSSPFQWEISFRWPHAGSLIPRYFPSTGGLGKMAAHVSARLASDAVAEELHLLTRCTLSLAPAPNRSCDSPANEMLASSVETCFHLWWVCGEWERKSEKRREAGRVDAFGAADSTNTPHSATISTWLLCARKDGLPAHRTIHAVVFSPTVHYCGVLPWVWLKCDSVHG